MPEISPAPKSDLPKVLAFDLCGRSFAGIIEYANIPKPIPVYLLNIPSIEMVCGVFAPAASLNGVYPATRPSKLFEKFFALMAIGWPEDAAISELVMLLSPARMPAPLEILLHCDLIDLETFLVALRRLVLVTALVLRRLFFLATYIIKRKCIYLFHKKKV